MVDKIVRLTKRHIDQMSIIDSESDRELSKKMKLSRYDLKKKLHARFDKEEIFFGYKSNGELIAYISFSPHSRATSFSVKRKDEGKKIDNKLTRYVTEHYNKNKL